MGDVQAGIVESSGEVRVHVGHGGEVTQEAMPGSPVVSSEFFEKIVAESTADPSAELDAEEAEEEADVDEEETGVEDED